MSGTAIAPGLRGALSLLLRLLLIAGIVYLAFCHLYSIRLRSFSPNAHLPTFVHSPSEGIPQKIWQTWHTPAGLLAHEDKERIRTWHEKNPNYQYELVTDQAAESFVRQHFAEDPLIRGVFLNLTDPIVRADLLRYLLILAQGGVYADMDVECRTPIDTWVPLAFQGQASVVLGIENDRKPVENDVKLYQDHREHIWGITNWTFMSKRGHPFLRFVAQTVAENLMKVAHKQEQTISSMDLSYKEVIDATGPGAFTRAFFEYTSEATGTVVTSANATMLEEPRLIGDILILPIRAFSTSEASRSGAEGAHSDSWPTLIYHWSLGTWKKTHSQKPEVKIER